MSVRGLLILFFLLCLPVCSGRRQPRQSSPGPDVEVEDDPAVIAAAAALATRRPRFNHATRVSRQVGPLHTEQRAQARAGRSSFPPPPPPPPLVTEEELVGGAGRRLLLAPEAGAGAAACAEAARASVTGPHPQKQQGGRHGQWRGHVHPHRQLGRRQRQAR